MGLMDLAGSAGAALRKVPGLKQIGEYGDDYVTTGNKKSLAKVMTPFAVGAAIPTAMFAAPAVVGSNMLAGGAALTRGAASRVSNLSGGLAKVAQGVKNVARKPIVGKAAGAGAVGVGAGVAIDQFRQGTQGNDPNSDQLADGSGMINGGGDGGGGNGGGGGNWSPNSDDYEKQKARFIKDTEKGYSNLKKAIKAQLKFGDSFSTDLEKRIRELVDTYTNTLGEQTKVGLGQIDKIRGDVAQSQKKSLRTLAENVRTGFQQGNSVLGGAGASDSSAAGQYSRALTKQANQERGVILEEIDGQFKELAQREGQVKAFAQSELEKITSWKDSKINAIKTSFEKYRKALTKQYKNADDNKKDDIEALDQKRLTRAYQEIQSIVDQASQWETTLVGVSDEMLGKIDTLKQYIVENTDYTPKEVDVKGLTDLGKMEEDQDDPAVQQQKKRKKISRSFLDNPLTDDEELNVYDEEYQFD